jgi:hypothetical protein
MHLLPNLGLVERLGGLSIFMGISMKTSFRATTRYRLVDLRTGQVLIVFQAYARKSPWDSCRLACDEFGVKPTPGHYRLDGLIRSLRTGKFRWSRRYEFVLKSN